MATGPGRRPDRPDRPGVRVRDRRARSGSGWSRTWRPRPGRCGRRRRGGLLAVQRGNRSGSRALAAVHRRASTGDGKVRASTPSGAGTEHGDQRRAARTGAARSIAGLVGQHDAQLGRARSPGRRADSRRTRVLSMASGTPLQQGGERDLWATDSPAMQRSRPEDARPSATIAPGRVNKRCAGGDQASPRRAAPASPFSPPMLTVGQSDPAAVGPRQLDDDGQA